MPSEPVDLNPPRTACKCQAPLDDNGDPVRYWHTQHTTAESRYVPLITFYMYDCDYPLLTM